MAAGPGARLHVRELVWGAPAAELPTGPFDYILASDICYDSDCYPALIQTMTQLTARNPDTKVHCPVLQLLCPLA